MRKIREKGSSGAGGEQSWRDLAGPKKRKINSPQAKKRRQLRWFRLLGALAVLILMIAAISWAIITIKNRDTSIQITTPSEPVKGILFRTNGVLPNSWLSSVAEIRPGMTLMGADIFALKERLEAFGQVSSASVERIFPSDLKITVTEKIPAMRLTLMDQSGKQVVKIVARDGTVYKGVGYPQATVDQLPFLDPYRNADGSIFPLRGTDRVAKLLELVSQSDPKLYRTWKVVSLAHFSGDLDFPGQVIEIRSTVVPKILFSGTKDYGRQLDRLNYIFEYVRERGNQAIERIDLSLTGAAAVQFSGGKLITF